MIRSVTGLFASLSLMLQACGGGGSGSAAPTSTPSPTPTPTAPLYPVPAAQSLGTGDVQAIIAHAAAEAQARSLPAVIAVSDRVGNVLAVFRMTGATATARTVPAPNGVNADAQNLIIPAEVGAIAKAITGAYLSSGGNAFSTRTASALVQQSFPPSSAAAGLESGPLFGVQFSQLPCSDLSARFGADAMIGPKRSPLGLAADPGGFPLYKDGVLVGGIGVMADGVYGLDPEVLDVDDSPEEAIALAGTLGYEAAVDIRADRIPFDGTLLRYSDMTYDGLKTRGTATYASTAPALGGLVAVTGYAAAVIVAGAVYGGEASGVRAATEAEFSNRDAFVLSNGAGANRYPIIAGADRASVSTPITAAEARAILEDAFTVMSRARAQIRRPLGSRAQVSISLVDSQGAVLGLIRSPDAPVFGADVALQKARTASFFSNAAAETQLLADPSANVRSFVTAARAFPGVPDLLSGQFAFSARAHGNLARPYFPDGQVGRPNGPFSRPIAQFNPFSTGLQSALILTNLAQHLAFVTGAAIADTARGCTFLPAPNRLANGVQIFAGGMPIYRGNVLVGGIGVSGDGAEQDDLVAFLGLHQAGARVGGIGNAPAGRRADTLAPGNPSSLLRYVNCPTAPFLDTSAQNACQGF